MKITRIKAILIATLLLSGSTLYAFAGQALPEQAIAISTESFTQNTKSLDELIDLAEENILINDDKTTVTKKGEYIDGVYQTTIEAKRLVSQTTYSDGSVVESYEARVAGGRAVNEWVGDDLYMEITIEYDKRIFEGLECYKITRYMSYTNRVNPLFNVTRLEQTCTQQGDSYDGNGNRIAGWYAPKPHAYNVNSPINQRTYIGTTGYSHYTWPGDRPTVRMDSKLYYSIPNSSSSSNMHLYIIL